MPNTFNADLFDKFETITGIAVTINYAESADEIAMKLRATQGRGYDLVMVADYQIPHLIKEGIIQSLDHTQLPFFDDIYPVLLNHAFDPSNHYSIPYYWGVYGFGIDKNFFGNKTVFSWHDLFHPAQCSCVGMREDIRELIFIAAYYLFNRVDNLSDAQFEEIKKLLVAQKKYVTLYADERIDSLLISQTCPLVLTISGDIARLMSHYPSIDFVIPKEGSFVDIDSFVIPSLSESTADIYTFLRFLYLPATMSHYARLFRFSPPVKTVKTYAEIPLFVQPTQELFSRLHFFATVIPQSRISDILIALKAA
jgi:spermidine/putrescine transport system substrate-binding protein